MTKKDYELIANVLYHQRPSHSSVIDHDMQRWVIMCNAFATALESTNPRFNRTRFLTACGAGSGS